MYYRMIDANFERHPPKYGDGVMYNFEGEDDPDTFESEWLDETVEEVIERLEAGYESDSDEDELENENP